MDLGLKGMKALVTGATRGLGRAIAETLAEEGVDLAICARTADALPEAEQSLSSRGINVFSRAVDVGDGEALQGFIADGAEALGGLDILVSNPSGGNGSNEAAWRANFEVDVLGSVRSVEAALPALSASSSPSVLFIGTTAAVETFIGPTSYNAMKAALVTHANGLSQALGGKGIRVNTVSPGPIFVEGGAWDNIKQGRPEMYEEAQKGHPGGKMGEAQDVANAAVFLSSPAAKHITGVNLIVDGGFTKRVNF
ncbi:MAG: SDR family oxidoreductase [Myxococcota bacterium]|nr:SDR family oxidoreductase [Myxococcota bacterium]